MFLYNPVFLLVATALVGQRPKTVFAALPAPLLRGNTYCEVIWAGAPRPASAQRSSSSESSKAPTTTATVSWNGTGGICPASPGYYNLTEADIRAVHGNEAAAFVFWNGIRQWMLDAFLPQQPQPQQQQQQPSSSSPSSSSGGTGEVLYEYGTDIFPDGSGMVMRRQATLEIDLTGGGTAKPYTVSPVTRNVTAAWSANTTVYELVDGSPCGGRTYVMQSIMLGRPEHWGITSEDLPELASRFRNLPDGWTFRNRTLNETLYVYGTNGTTNVLQDEFGNAYSQMDVANGDDGDDQSPCQQQQQQPQQPNQQDPNATSMEQDNDSTASNNSGDEQSSGTTKTTNASLPVFGGLFSIICMMVNALLF